MPSSISRKTVDSRKIEDALHFPRYHLPRLIPRHIRPRRPWVVRENRQPLFWQRPGVIFLLTLDRLQRIQVEGHSPSQVDVRRRRYQVGDIARRSWVPRFSRFLGEVGIFAG